MGWTGSQFSGNVKDFLISENSGSDADFRWSYVDVSMRGSVAYGIHLREDKHTGITLAEALIILTRKEKGGWLYTKALGETVHPYYYDAPKKLLDKLDSYPPLNDDAIQWRAKCRENIKRAKIKLKNGDMVRFAKPFTFTFRNGKVSADTFEYVEYQGKRNIFKVDNNLVRITNFNKREFTVLSN